MSHAVTYASYSAAATRHDSVNVVALNVGDNIIGQISELPSEDGFLIRVWPPNGTHENGGGNLTALSLSISFDADGKPTLGHLHWDNRP